jgi:hypothetical protein
MPVSSLTIQEWLKMCLQAPDTHSKVVNHGDSFVFRFSFARISEVNRRLSGSKAATPLPTKTGN